MKALFRKEGFNFTRDHCFSDPKSYFSKFEFMCHYKPFKPFVMDGFFTFEYFITDDGYLQVIRFGNGDHPLIIAQFPYYKYDLKSQVRDTLESYIVEARHWDLPYPGNIFIGKFFTHQELDEFNSDLRTRILSNTARANQDPPLMVAMLNSFHLMPEPHGGDQIKWVCVCPRCRNKVLMFSRLREHWQCSACSISGMGLRDMKMAVEHLRKNKASELRKNIPALN